MEGSQINMTLTEQIYDLSNSPMKDDDRLQLLFYLVADLAERIDRLEAAKSAHSMPHRITRRHNEEWVSE